MGLLRAWNRFWFSPYQAWPAAVFRITLGTLIVADFLCVFPSWEKYYAGSGMLSLYDPTVNSPVQGWWTLFWWTEGVVPVYVYWWAGIVTAVAFTLGWHTRIATVVLFLIISSTVHRNPMVVNGEDLVFRMVLFYSCFTPLGLLLSLDARRRSGRREPVQAGGYGNGMGEPARASRRSSERGYRSWPMRLIQINTLLIYVFSQPYKLVEDSVWRSGDAMYYAMVNQTWSRWPWPELFYDPWVSGLTTYSSLVLELLFPFLVWIPRMRLYAIVAMIALHVSIAVVLANVTFFTLAMPCALLVFLKDDEVRGLLAWVHRRALQLDFSR